MLPHNFVPFLCALFLNRRVVSITVHFFFSNKVERIELLEPEYFVVFDLALHVLISNFAEVNIVFYFIGSMKCNIYKRTSHPLKAKNIGDVCVLISPCGYLAYFSPE